MDDAYAYEIGQDDFDPGNALAEIITLGNYLSGHFQSRLSSQEEASLEEKILSSLALMVYGSNMLELAGLEIGVTLKLSMAIFRGEEAPEDIGETTKEF
ncbi:hypothetical protein N7495_005058 [Penicillium taxi]|uniref:uncharacterized protein n=1 Tax=Penicillium taxi TaxID=168475 RepID=UPI0025454EE3|nr:uncharacterized protein N7495_005058 [Penicillium taxi]KAJ5893367.1 hypothetical protein N7495_005058 [Penicillium taxi]